MALNQRDIGIKFRVINKGIGATTTSVILSKLEDFLNRYNPDMVVTMMGVNDEDCSAPYEDTPPKKTTLLLKSFRLYKLAKFLRLHIINKAQEIGIYKPKEIREDIHTGINNPTPPNNLEIQEKLHKKTIEINPKNAEAYVDLGYTYKHQGKYEKAKEMFKKAIQR